MKRNLLLRVAVFLAAVSIQADAGKLSRPKRQARSNVGGCNVSPAGADNHDTPAKENEMVSIICSTDTAFSVCNIKHVHPMHVGQYSGNSNNYDDDEWVTSCVAKEGDNGMSCDKDPRIQYVIGSNQCGVKISRSMPEDVGNWEFRVFDFGQTNPNGNSKTVEIFTYNKTIVDFTDDRDDEITRNIELWYNYDENEEEIRSGSSGIEQVKLNCNARGGRPEPTITWMINNNDRLAFGEDLNNGDADRIFNPSEQYVKTYDPQGYIRDKASQLDFSVNKEFLQYIQNGYGINTNPEGEQFSFELTCIVDQGDYGSEELSMTVNIRRIYFRNGFDGWEIFGITIGAIAAFLLLCTIIIVACCAYIKGLWCFEDPNRRYDDANNPKRRPRTQ